MSDEQQEAANDVFDFALIGAGIAGASLGWRLAEHASVVLLEAEAQLGYHSTGRSAALFMETYGPPGVQALTRASRAFYENPPEGFTDTPILAPRGVLYVATREQRELLERRFAQDRARAANVRLVALDEMLSLVPVLRADVVERGMAEAGAADIDVHALHQGFLRGFRARGGALHSAARVVTLARERSGWRIGLDSGESLRARHLVNAAGAWADEIALIANVRPIGLVPRRRSAFTFAPPPGIEVAHWPAVVGIAENFYFKPDAGQLLGSPANADATDPHDVLPEEIDIATGIYEIEQVTTLTIRRPSHTWAGLRSFVADGELVIGWDDPDTSAKREPGGFFWLAAQGGYGIQSAAAASLLALELLLGRPMCDELRAHGVDAATVRLARLR